MATQDIIFLNTNLFFKLWIQTRDFSIDPASKWAKRMGVEFSQVSAKTVLTLVVISLVIPFESNAAPYDPDPVSGSLESQMPEVSSDSTKDLEGMSVPVLPILPTKTIQQLQNERAERGAARDTKVAKYFRYRQSISPRLGLYLNSQSVADSIPYVLGIRYMLPSDTNPYYELGADLDARAAGTVSLDYRHIFRSTHPFRPYLTAGGALRVFSKEGLGTLVNYQNLIARSSLGVEQLMIASASLRLDLQFGIGLKTQSIILSLGYSWAW